MVLQRYKITNPVLHLLQQRRVRILFGIVKKIDSGQVELLLRLLCVIEVVELTNEVPTLASPGGKQRMRVGMHVFQRQGRQFPSLTKGLATSLGIEQLASIHDVPPVVLAGVGNGQHHLAVL